MRGAHGSKPSADPEPRQRHGPDFLIGETPQQQLSAFSPFSPLLDMARPKPRQPNPISAAVKEWFEESRPNLSAVESDNVEQLVAEAPKRWVTYEPMVLLPSGSFTSPLWTETLAMVTGECRDELWRRILHKIGQKTPEETTHLAVNDGIPLTLAAHLETGQQGAATCQPEGKENILRSPVGLRTLYGNFGPEAVGRLVSDEDFSQALWASTKQNGIHQIWAPRWTMFSRGNVKEKARLLAFHERPRAVLDDGKEPQLPHRVGSGPALKGTWAVDLYAGIGYFVFSYAKLGIKVLGWELNPWSVEGLRRGAQANGWSVKVVQGDDLTRPTQELVSGGDTIVVFQENNQEAARRIQELRADSFDLSVSHVNCGLLPRSDDSWHAAREMLGGGARGGWLHLHENVGVKDIESRRAEMQSLFDDWDQRDGTNGAAKVEHVELVKTFAPDVWHCVFDVYITRSSGNSTS